MVVSQPLASRSREQGRVQRDLCDLPDLRELAGRVAPITQAGEQRLPLAPSLAGLFPGDGLRRGSTVGITCTSPGAGAVSLALTVLAGPSAAGSWTAVVGMPSLGSLAASELGIDLARFALVPDPGPSWPTVVAALLDAIDVVAVAPPSRVRASDARRLTARARERGSVLVIVGNWPEGPDVRLSVAHSTWTGLGRGYGRLTGRTIDVEGSGRGAAARPRSVSVCQSI